MFIHSKYFNKKLLYTYHYHKKKYKYIDVINIKEQIHEKKKITNLNHIIYLTEF